MKTKSKISGPIIRSGAWAVFLSVAFIALSSASNSPNTSHKSAVATVGYDSTAKSPSQPRAFSFAERVAYQRAIEDVYWRHRIWPKENPDPKPVARCGDVSGAVGKEGYGLSTASHRRWRITGSSQLLPISYKLRWIVWRSTPGNPRYCASCLQALGNDPFVIAECLARPLLAERLLTHSASEQVKQMSLIYQQVAAATGDYSLPSVSDQGGCTDDTWTATSTTNAPSGRVDHTAVWTGSEMIVWGGDPGSPYVMFNTGGRYNPSTDSWTATSTDQCAFCSSPSYGSVDRH